MDETESGILLPAGVRSVRPVAAPAPWLDGEQMGHVDEPIGWLDLRMQVRQMGSLFARAWREHHGRL